MKISFFEQSNALIINSRVYKFNLISIRLNGLVQPQTVLYQAPSTSQYQPAIQFISLPNQSAGSQYPQLYTNANAQLLNYQTAAAANSQAFQPASFANLLPSTPINLNQALLQNQASLALLQQQQQQQQQQQLLNNLNYNNLLSGTNLAPLQYIPGLQTAPQLFQLRSANPNPNPPAASSSTTAANSAAAAAAVANAQQFLFNQPLYRILPQ